MAEEKGTGIVTVIIFIAVILSAAMATILLMNTAQNIKDAKMFENQTENNHWSTYEYAAASGSGSTETTSSSSSDQPQTI